VFTLVSEGCKVDICVMNNTQGNMKMPFTEDLFFRLQGMYSVVRDENVQLTADVLYYKNEIAQLKRMIFGAKSERFVAGEDSSQLLLGLNLTEPMAEPVKTETITYERKQKEENKQLVHSRLPLPSHLPRHEEVIEPIEKPAGARKIGEEITEILEYTPGALIVRRIVRPKYLLPKEDNKDPRIVIADLPSLPIPKGIAGPGLLTHIIISKYVDHLPIYRQAQQFKRQGVEIAESTMVDWIHQCCDLLAPLYETLKESVLKCKYLQADETPIPVLTKDKPGATHKGYLWVYRDVIDKLILFEYQKTRSREGPQKILNDFTGTLQTDGYTAYNIFDKPGKITLLACMAHARRKFETALDNDKVRAGYALTKIQALYSTERKARESGYSFEQRKELREQESLPILAELEEWMKQNITQVMPKSAIGIALAYTLNLWNRLNGYLLDGKYEIDNNLIENSIRPVALGRKNYLFAGSHDAAQRTAMLYSFLGSCKMNDVEPSAWLKDVLIRLPDYKANKLHGLLPNSRTSLE